MAGLQIVFTYIPLNQSVPITAMAYLHMNVEEDGFFFQCWYQQLKQH